MIIINRNVESHFSELPSVDIQRSIFDRSSSHKTTFNVGEIIPIYLDEVLPGDTFDITTSKVVRLQTLLDPIMDNMYLDTYFFFVPNRLTWSHWKEFCGENTASSWIPSVVPNIPRVKFTNGIGEYTIADYMGLPINLILNGTEDFGISALPFRAYYLICDTFFRDQNLQLPYNILFTDVTQEYTDLPFAGKPAPACKYHDYFTSCLPSPQKGPDVSFNLINGELAPVITGEYHNPFGLAAPDAGGQPVVWTSYRSGWKDFDPTTHLSYNGYILTNNGNDGSSSITAAGDGRSIKFTGYDDTKASPSRGSLTPINLWANISDTVGAVTINQLRLSFALQRYYEKAARSGSRYIETLKAFFGVTSPDARIQIPEYLGGNRIPLNIHQVTNTSQNGESAFLGDIGAMSVTSDVHNDFQKSFTEHGYIIGLCVARYDHSYSQGVDKLWTRSEFTDFYLPTFANIGEQPVYQHNIYATGENMNLNSSSGLVFGYQEAWAEYRYKPNIVTGEMRPQNSRTLSSWHLGDNYIGAPVLGDSWIRESKSNVDRVLAVSSTNANQILADFYFQNKCTRPMPMYSIPGLLDHN